jgi:hypothetical protein
MSILVNKHTKVITQGMTGVTSRISPRGALALFSIGVAALAAGPVSAEPRAEYPSAVDSFSRICLTPGVDPASRLAAISALTGWSQDDVVTVDVPKLQISRTIDANYSFGSVSTARQWSGTIDGRPARIVLASFSGKVRYPNLCALVLDGINNAMPYGSTARDAFKTFGIGGKSVDLVHYYEFAGKVGPDKHPVRGEVFSRSLAGQSSQTMHIYVAY